MSMKLVNQLPERLSDLISLMAGLFRYDKIILSLSDGLTVCFPLDASVALEDKFHESIVLKSKEQKILGELHLLCNARILPHTENKVFLTSFISLIIAQIEDYLTQDRLLKAYSQTLNKTAHDLKNPLTTISVRADLIKLKKNEPEIVQKMCEQIKSASLKMTGIIDELLPTVQSNES